VWGGMSHDISMFAAAVDIGVVEADGEAFGGGVWVVIWDGGDSGAV